MSNRLALALGLIILAGAGADQFLNDSDVLMFLLRKSFDFVEWVAFWR